MKNFRSFRWFSCILAAFIILFTGIESAHTATINVTANATDTLNGADGQCSLREAITNINNGATTYTDCVPTGDYGTSDTINIPAGTYTTATTEYSTEFCSMAGRDNIVATQFHAEKSGPIGLTILERFAAWDGTC